MSSEQLTAAQLRVTAETRRLIGELQAMAHRSVMQSLPAGEPRRYLYDLLTEYPSRSGKGLRPVLCMASCAAFGGSFAAALPFATALELLHTAFLVHDDIQDGSSHRRGRPALHVEHGVPLALNAGDALAALAGAGAVRAARRLKVSMATPILEGWERMIRETLEGQALDLGWQRDNVVDLSLSDYLRMVGKKTAWYTTIEPVAIGALLGSGRLDRAQRTLAFGWFLGLVFQIANDLKAAVSTPGEGDIEEGKRTILVIHLLGALSGAERRELVRIMGLPSSERGSTEVAWVRAQMQAHGSVEFARASMFGIAGAALREAEQAFGPLADTPSRDLLLSITAHVLEQDGVLQSA
jgi:geranylgeranyl diphosphate synthase type II